MFEEDHKSLFDAPNLAIRYSLYFAYSKICLESAWPFKINHKTIDLIDMITQRNLQTLFLVQMSVIQKYKNCTYYTRRP